MELVLTLRDTSRALQTFFTAQARASGLGLTALTTLIRAADGGGVTPAEAGRALGLQRSSMTAISDRLERRRLIRRVRHPTDRRLLILKATPEGHKLLAQVIGPLLGRLTEVAVALDDDWRHIIGQFLTTLNALLLQASTTDLPSRSTDRARHAIADVAACRPGENA